MSLVFVDKLPNGLVGNCVMSDPLQAMDALIGHLYNMGHRRIAMVTHDLQLRSSALQRLQMGRLAMQKYGLDLPDRYIRSSQNWDENIVDLVSLPQPPPPLCSPPPSSRLTARRPSSALESASRRISPSWRTTTSSGFPKFTG